MFNAGSKWLPKWEDITNYVHHSVVCILLLGESDDLKTRYYFAQGRN